jgi:hypothetical protein
VVLDLREHVHPVLGALPGAGGAGPYAEDVPLPADRHPDGGKEKACWRPARRGL